MTGENVIDVVFSVRCGFGVSGFRRTVARSIAYSYDLELVINIEPNTFPCFLMPVTVNILFLPIIIMFLALPG